MKRFKLALLLVCFASLIGCSSASDSDGGNTLEGQLVTASGSPVSDATVTLFKLEGSVSAYTSGVTSTSDENGYYSFSGLDTGHYHLEARTDYGYSMHVSDIELDSASDLNLGPTTTRFAGVIEGTIRLTGEETHADIDVYIPGTSFHAKTDSNGTFSLEDVPEGEYTIYGSKLGFIPSFAQYVTVNATQRTSLSTFSLDTDSDFVRVGDDGDDGADGADGIDGRQGTEWHFWSIPPSDSLGDDGDIFFNTSDKNLYYKSSGTWSSVGAFPGEDGHIGVDGPAGEDGTLPEIHVATVLVSASELILVEGNAGLVSFSLTGPPIDEVIVSINMSPADQITLSTDSLTFNPSNWADAQVVTVTAIDDSTVEGEHTASLNFTVTSYDAYHGSGVRPVTITINDPGLD